MNKPKVDRRVRKTKEALRKGLITLMKEKTLQEISVQELTELVDIHRGTFYLHYRDIYDLYEQTENEVLYEISQIFEDFILTDIADKHLDPEPVLEKILFFVEENEEICKILLAPDMNATFVKKLSDVLKNKFLDHSIQRMDLEASNNEIMYLTDFLVYGYIAVISNWLNQGMPEPVPLMADRIGKYGAFGISYYQFD